MTVLLVLLQFLLIYFFFWSVSLAGTCSTVLSKTIVSGYPYLDPELKRKSFHLFTIEYKVSCGFVLYGLSYVDVYSSVPSLLRVLMKKQFCECFFCTYWGNHIVFIFILFVYSIYWFACIELALNLRDKSSF